MTNKYPLHLNVQIIYEIFGPTGLTINEDAELHVDSFAEITKILEAFHVLVEQFRERSDAPKR